MAKFKVLDDYQDALRVLNEFVADIEAAGEKAVEADWPDLFVTYLKARRLVRDDESEANP